MKRLFLAFTLLFTILITPTASATSELSCSGDTNDFYFEDFTADYYLTRDEQGISHLRVVEHLTAVFPECDQNRGIVREIPFTNQDGKNITLPRLNISATRNGQPEQVANIEHSGNVYLVYLGNSAEYVHGRQEYTLEYEFEKVITDFTRFQELYWDANGTGWRQPFESVTAILHVEEPLLSQLSPGKAWCYVGSYGESGQDRCSIISTTDGYIFTAADLARGENLTFDVEFAADTFTVPEPPLNWTLVLLAAAEAVIIFLIARHFYRKTWAPTAEKRHWYKYAPVAPQYSPLKGHTVGELAAIYLGKIKNPKVATLLELAVQDKIQFRKEEKTFKNAWYIKIKSLHGLSREQHDVLKLLAGGTAVAAGDEFKVKKHTYSSTLASIEKSYDKDILSSLKNRHYVEKSANSLSNATPGGNLFAAIIILLILVPNVAVLLFGLIALTDTIFIGISTDDLSRVVGGSGLFFSIIAAAILATIILSILSGSCRRFKERTKSGLELSIYSEGLRQYISLAEAERIEFLQGVKGADTSTKGIVRLHEKLLPYAVLFGLEKSWMAELAHYYELEPELSPAWYAGAGYLSTRDFSSAMSTISSPSVISPSSSGGSSSGSSGGGGGGFSGGGGGGGGGGGW